MLRVGLAGMTVMALFMTGCGNDGEAQVDPETGVRTIKFIHIPGALDNIPLYVADEFGFFAEQGLDVKYTSAGGGQAGMQAMIAGESDFTTATVGAVALVNAQGADARFASRFEDRFTAGLVCNRAVGATPGGIRAACDPWSGRRSGSAGRARALTSSPGTRC
jgi:ABC-type nitrate/sulfonate/bicarbonate transport system substrate-binding protein